MGNNYPPSNRPNNSNNSYVQNNSYTSQQIPGTPQEPIYRKSVSPEYDPYTQHMVKPKKSKAPLIVLIVILALIFTGLIGVAAYTVLRQISTNYYQANISKPENEADNAETEKSVQDIEKKLAETDAAIKQAELEQKEAELKQKEEELARMKEEQKNNNSSYNPTGSTYNVYKSNATWTQAYSNTNGSLVCIDSSDEFNRVCNLASSNGLSVFWVDPASTYTKWYPGEPSFVDENGNPENYLMVFKVNGVWYFNDSINDVSGYYSGKMGYITEN